MLDLETLQAVGLLALLLAIIYRIEKHSQRMAIAFATIDSRFDVMDRKFDAMIERDKLAACRCPPGVRYPGQEGK
ncbi:hypothetical protein DFH06DRAFT_1480403, partial [Mycena polygramma]